MIGFKDFLPGQLPKTGFLKAHEYANVNSVMPEINGWLETRRGQIRVLQFETVVMPVFMGAGQAEFYTGDSFIAGGGASRQFIRVWYETADNQ